MIASAGKCPSITGVVPLGFPGGVASSPMCRRVNQAGLARKAEQEERLILDREFRAHFATIHQVEGRREARLDARSQLRRFFSR